MAWREAALDPQPQGEGHAVVPVWEARAQRECWVLKGSTPQASSQPLEGPTKEDVVTDKFKSLNQGGTMTAGRRTLATTCKKFCLFLVGARARRSL